MKTQEKKEMEYPDAPSGYVMLYNYKEPFMRFEEGYGYQGVLLFDGINDQVQCHLCGEWQTSLPHHLRREHNTNAADYKRQVGLSQTSALISESTREKLIANAKNGKGLEERKKNLRPGKKHRPESIEKIRQAILDNANRRETQNKRGTCPEQLIDRLRKDFARLGRTPTTREAGYLPTIIKVYGSWKNACEIAGVPYREPGKAAKDKLKYHEAEIIIWIREFYDANGRLPRRMDHKQLYEAGRARWGWKNLCLKAMISDGKYRKVSHLRHGPEGLLLFLRKFSEIHGRNPAVSDCKRGLLPHASRYIYHFGSWKGALKAAGL